MFRHGAIFCLVEESQWHQATYTWAVFDAFLESLHGRRKDMFKLIITVLLDESMIGWRPKSTKTGGLPNITFEPRKPVNLGTMLRNCAERSTGILLYHQIVKDPDRMHQLPYFNEVKWHMLSSHTLTMS